MVTSEKLSNEQGDESAPMTGSTKGRRMDNAKFSDFFFEPGFFSTHPWRRRSHGRCQRDHLRALNRSRAEIDEIRARSAFFETCEAILKLWLG